MLKFWVQLPQAGGVASPRNIRAYAALAEELGFTGVWLGDHIVLPDTYESQYPYGAAHPVASDRPFLEALTTLAYVAGATRRVRLATAVLVAPYRHPLLQAKQIATLDALSGGRLEIGVGAGWLAEEFEALGIKYEDRQSLTDETIEVMKKLWSGKSVTHAGKHFTLNGVTCLPMPAQRAGPPLWIGGISPRALRRVVEMDAGWLAPAQTLAEVAALVARLRELGNGRSPRAAARVTLHTRDSPTERDGHPSVDPGGSADIFVSLEQAGVTDVRLELTTLPPRKRLGAIAELARTLEDAGLKPGD
jgi:probable F420-dependent oxidoreductase